MKKGKWAKVSGGDFGVVFHGGAWRRFACLYCARAQGILKSNLKMDYGELSQTAKEAINRPVAFICHGAEMHKVFLKQKERGEI